MAKKNNYDGGYEEHRDDLSDWHWERGVGLFGKSVFPPDAEGEIHFLGEIIDVINELYEMSSLDEMIRAKKAKENEDDDNLLATFIILKDQVKNIQRRLELKSDQLIALKKEKENPTGQY